MPDLRSFLEELKRRKVVRTAWVYMIAAWAVVEVTSVVADPLFLPDATLTVVVLLAIVGFPVALTLEWLYEATREEARLESDPVGRVRGLGRVGVAVLVVCSAGLVGWRWFASTSARGSGDEQAPDEASSAIAVLPCVVRGSDEVDLLSEGVAELLATALRGTDVLSPVDPRSVIRHIEREGIDTGDPEAGRGVATQFGAGGFLQCSVNDFSGTRRATAALYHLGEGDGPDFEVTAEGDDPFALVDELAARILVRVGGSATRLVSVADLTTDSLEALKAFVDGQRAYRMGRWVEAMTRYRDAVEIDPTFTAAQYGLSSAAGWAERGDVSAAALEAALSQADRLSDQQRARLQALHAYRRGAHAEGLSLLEDLVRLYPDDGEASYLLGEIVFHYGGFAGVPLSVGAEALRRAEELDPGVYPDVLFHLSNHAAMIGDLERLRSTTERMIGLDPDPAESSRYSLAPFVRGQWVLYGGDEAARDSLTAALAGGAPLPNLLLDIAPDLETADRLARAVASPAQPVDERVKGRLKQAGVAVARGRWADARAALDTVAAVRPALAREFAAYLALVSAEALPTEQLQAAADTLRGWDGTVADEGTRRTFDRPHAGLHPWLRLYLLGLLEARLGQVDEAQGRASTLDGADGVDGLGPWRENLAVIVRAEAARSEGAPEEALRILTGAPLWSTHPQREVDARLSPILNHFYPIVLRAELLAESGRFPEALRWYRALEIPFWMPTDALSSRYLLGKAGVLARLGEDAEARAIVEALAVRWEDGAPEFSALLDELRRHATPTVVSPGTPGAPT